MTEPLDPQRPESRELAASRTDRPPGLPIRPSRLGKEARNEKDRRAIQRALDGMTPTNRTDAASFLRWKEQANKRLGVIRQYAAHLGGLDRHTNGAPWRALAPAQASDWLLAEGRRIGTGSVQQAAIHPRHFLRWLHDSDELPKGFRRATATGRPERLNNKRPIPAEHKDLLLDAIGKDDPMNQAALWVLWETGFRISELCSLNVGSFEKDTQAGAILRLPDRKDARFFLKTGPRAPYVVDCVGPLQAWLDLHPFANNPTAPLFLVRSNQAKGASWLPMGPDRLYRDLKAWCHFAEVGPYRPHDFRHTAATHKARLGWNASQANPYFGWSPGSTMFDRVYVHLAQQDMKDRVRRDAGIDENGHRLSTPSLDDKAMEQRFRKWMRKMVMEESG